MTFKNLFAATLVVIVGFGSVVITQAATRSARVNLRVEIPSRANLSADAGGVSGLSAERSGSGVSASVRAGSSPVTLTLQATHDSGDGIQTVPAAAATATTAAKAAAFPPDQPGARNNASRDSASGQGCSGSYTETFNLYLEKSWSCANGNRPVTLTYTLSAP